MPTMTAMTATPPLGSLQRWLALGLAGAAATALVAAIVLLAVRPWQPDSPQDIDAFTESLNDHVAVQSTAPSPLISTMGALHAQTVTTVDGRLHIFELPAGVKPPTGSFISGEEGLLGWPDGPFTTVSTTGPVFLVTKGQLVVVTPHAALATRARDILGLPGTQCIAPVTFTLEWAIPFARELQRQGYFVTRVTPAIPIVSQESAFIDTDRGALLLELLPEGIDAASAKVVERSSANFAIVIPGLGDTQFGGLQAADVRVSGRGRFLAITYDLRLAEPAANALAAVP
jgi:hypothetical protein